jgi:hypothetical protein
MRKILILGFIAGAAALRGQIILEADRLVVGSPNAENTIRGGDGGAGTSIVDFLRGDNGSTVARIMGTGQWRGPDGTAAAPAHTYQSDTTTGHYRVSSGQVGFSSAGTRSLTFAGNGTIIGALNQAIAMGANGNIDVTATGTNQSITLTPSGTGRTLISVAGASDSATAARTNSADNKSVLLGASSTLGFVQSLNGPLALNPSLNRVLINTSTDDGTNALQVAGSIAAEGSIIRTGAPSTARSYRFRTGALDRWTMYTSGDPESTGNAGSNFAIARFDDVGSVIGNALFISRASGGTSLNGTSAVLGVRTAMANLDFPSISGPGEQTLTVTVTGASVGNTSVVVNTADGVLINGGCYLSATVTAADTVTVRCANTTGSPVDPAAQNFRITVISF